MNFVYGIFLLEVGYVFGKSHFLSRPNCKQQLVETRPAVCIRVGIRKLYDDKVEGDVVEQIYECQNPLLLQISRFAARNTGAAG